MNLLSPAEQTLQPPKYPEPPPISGLTPLFLSKDMAVGSTQHLCRLAVTYKLTLLFCVKIL